MNTLYCKWLILPDYDEPEQDLFITDCKEWMKIIPNESICPHCNKPIKIEEINYVN